jgi:hypothetical protein
MAPELMQKFPSIRTFHLRSDSGKFRGEMEFTYRGFHAHVYDEALRRHSYIEPLNKAKKLYVAYEKSAGKLSILSKLEVNETKSWTCYSGAEHTLERPVTNHEQRRGR